MNLKGSAIRAIILLLLVFIVVLGVYRTFGRKRALQRNFYLRDANAVEPRQPNGAERLIVEAGRALERSFPGRPKKSLPNYLSPPLREDSTVLLATYGYGYNMGDIVQVDQVAEPKLDDIIVFDPWKNNSMCFTVGGPNTALAKVTGVPGETVTFRDNNLAIRGQAIPDPQPAYTYAIFGGKTYTDLANIDIVLQPGEYLTDNRVGEECRGFDEHGNSVPYKRFTVNKESLFGVVIGKVGHDDEAERYFKSLQY